MKHTIHYEAFEPLQYGEQAQPGLITEAQVLGLPEVMQRYLRYAGVVGKEPIRTVRLKQKGAMRQEPGQKWLPLVAEQYFTTTPPAFLWHASMLQDHRDRIQPIGKGDEVLRPGSNVCDGFVIKRLPFVSEV